MTDTRFKNFFFFFWWGGGGTGGLKIPIEKYISQNYYGLPVRMVAQPFKKNTNQ